MAEALKNKTISKTNSGFPQYLDFATLRSSAIAYLGKLSGNIWTDHNVHDPGITMLEVLIYALIDLGYRTNLPPADLFARDPADTSKDNNFFTASQILANNPLTITDFRKLLIDLAGVKNAWLETDDGTAVFEMVKGNVKRGCDADFLNGLYRVYVQLEEDVFGNSHRTARTLAAVRKALLSHRNLCEDFIDIRIVCQLELGICAEIELETDADPQEVYLEMVSALRDFFSPSPRFYSLQQLLDKNLSIEEIFAGRPYNITESHGFVDTRELEELKLKKELHLSDVYHLLFDMAGVRAVRNLGWIKCCGEKSTDEWKLVLPENHVPEFSVKCSGFTFTRNRNPVKVDTKEFSRLVELKFSSRQKALYTEPSPFLDAGVPEGIYHNDLAEYYSIQNEFPKVYGINEGGLAANSSPKRKAQALQMQGFLLFFDQLLANYLTQLKNMRSLFSLSSGKDENAHTYFVNLLTNTPQFQKLLRFKKDDQSGNILGSEGSILAYPTDRRKLQDLIDHGKLGNADLEQDCPGGIQFPPWHFCYAAERDQAVSQLKDDLSDGDYEPVVVSTKSGCYFFYLMTSSFEFALISKRYYKTEKEAADAAVSVKYSAMFSENYRRYFNPSPVAGDALFSFDIDLNLDVYAKFLQMIVEDKDLYMKRRHEFQGHLLSRFAERFTDFAMLSSGIISNAELPAKEIKATGRFLANYDDISSNRGKAYDYARNQWGKSNISGFEKRFMALTGIEDWRKHYLCNFIVEKADKLYKLQIDLFNTVFEVEDKILTEQQAVQALHSIFRKLNDPDFQLGFVPHEERWQVFILDDFGNKFSGKSLFGDQKEAAGYQKVLASLVHFRPDFSRDTQVTRYVYRTFVTDHSDQVLAESREHFADAAAADEFTAATNVNPSALLNDSEVFTRLSKKRKFDRMIQVSAGSMPFIYLDEYQFEFKPFDVIHLDKVKKSFSVVNKPATIQFDSLVEFDTAKAAREAFRKILALIPLESGYTVAGNKRGDEFRIIITEDNVKLAAYFETFASETEAREKIRDILKEISAGTYKLYSSGPIPYEWEFTYRTMDFSGKVISYISGEKFGSEDEVKQAASYFYSHIPMVNVKSRNKTLRLTLENQELKLQPAEGGATPAPLNVNEAKKMLKLSQDLFRNINKPTDADIAAILERSRINPGEDYVYKLVDRDNVLAFHPGESVIPGESEAEKVKDDLAARAITGYNYVDLNISADAIHTVKTVGKKTWYHFTVACSNRIFKKGKRAGKELVMFESVKGYATSDEALQALRENYLIILKKARDVKNYGVSAWISLREIRIYGDDQANNCKSYVFVPADTQYEFDGLNVPQKLAAMAASYPVRYLRKNKYAFILGNVKEDEGSYLADWRSKKTFPTSMEAMYQFRFLLILLKYAGNMYSEWNPVNCSWHIYIREVLAISAHGYLTAAEAWGTGGVEKFICTSQDKSGFHPYANRVTCSDSFYLACGSTGLYHPCTYDTPQRRDIAIDRLYKAAGFSFTDLITDEGDGALVLKNLKNEPVARIRPNQKRMNQLTPCDWLMKFIESVYDDRNYIREDNRFQLVCRLKNEKSEIVIPIAEPVSPDMLMNDWKDQLRNIACYFPVEQRTIECGSENAVKYFVTIKLPLFDQCGSDRADDPCLKQDVNCDENCPVAWQSDCCFDSCCEAMAFYIRSAILLGAYENYKPVFDCDCGPYRVAIHPQLTLAGKEAYDRKARDLAEKINWICRIDADPANKDEGNKINRQSQMQPCFSEIAAINPQLYANELMACEAVKRAKGLINSEGLHLVEHLLLRTRCREVNEQERECMDILKPCAEDENCLLKWVPGGEGNICDEDLNICFTPGADPYSFIASVALPAWPARFRSAENRKHIERILQREAPAHILLRILWLTPHDLFLFENYLREWNEWLAKKICDNRYSNCGFLRFLFMKKFELLPECRECSPCLCDDPQQSCFDNSGEGCAGFSMTSALNELYCWSGE
jgi:hypothetical protein